MQEARSIWVDAQGMSVHGRIFGTDGEALLLIHELGGSHRSWRDVAGTLAQRYVVCAVDLIGSGLSEKPLRRCPLALMADSAAEWAARAAAGRPVHVAGLAMGAVVAAIVAIRHPAMVRSLVLCDIARGMTPGLRRYVVERAAKVRREGMRAVVEASVTNSWPADMRARRPERTEEYRREFLANDPAAYAAASEALADMDLTDAQLATIACPTLVLAGEKDIVWPPDGGQEITRAIPGARFAMIEAAGHFPPMQAPSAFLEQISEFLGEA